MNRVTAKPSMDTIDDNAIRGQIRAGIGGWTFAPWRSNFYPAGLVQRRELEYASRQLTAIEINGTYYGTQKPATYAKWRDETPAGFIFSAKAPKRIMAARKLANTGAQIEDFVGGIIEIGDKLGPLVWQFERGVAVDREAFIAFLGLLPKTYRGRALRHVIDMRDPAFFDAQFLELLRPHNFATVFTDSPELPSFADLTADFVYARLMRSRSELVTGYPAAELTRWAQRARVWATGKQPDDLPRLEPQAGTTAMPRDVYLYFISAAKERNPAAAMALLKHLDEHS